MAGAGTKPTSKTYADLCFSQVGRNHTHPDVKKALDAAKAACTGVTGRDYGACMNANYQKFLIQKAQGALQTCGDEINISPICTYPGCSNSIRGEISAYLRGDDPKAEATQARLAQQEAQAAAVAEEGVRTVVDSEEDLINQIFPGQSVEETPKSAPLGVPLWAWIGGGVAVAYLVMRKK